MAEQRVALLRAAWQDMCAALAAGELIKTILASRGLTPDDLRAFLRAEPGARAEWDTAREASADSYFDELMESARDPKPRDWQQARLYQDALKWAARIRNPRLYSDKSTIDVNVKTVDLTKIIQDANARLLAQRQGRIINAEPMSNNRESSPDLAHAQPGLSAALDPVLLALM